MCFDQTIDGHSDYLYWLAHLFEPFIGAPVRPTDRKPDKRTGVIYTSLQFKTLAFPCFNFDREFFYDPLSITGKKIINVAIGQYFPAVSLAFWIMDDGYWHAAQSTIFLCTDSFTLEEVQLLCSILDSNLGIVATPNMRTVGSNTSYRIIISIGSL